MTIMPRMRFITIAAASISLAASFAPAQAAPSAGRSGSSMQAQNRSADSGRQICAVAKLTGTRMSRRICRTAAEWEAVGGVPTRD